MRDSIVEGYLGKSRLVLLALLFLFGLFSILGTGGGGGSSSDSGTTPGGDTTPATMKEDITGKANAILSVVTSEGVNEGMDVITSLLDDPNLESLVTFDPPLETIDDLSNLPEVINITLDFGAGYTTADGNLWTGSGAIAITDIQFTETALGADFTATFNNIAVNGATYLTGTVQGGISITEDAQGAMILSGSIGFQSFQWNGNAFSGSISLSGSIQGLDLVNPAGTITVTFNQLVMGQDRINGSVSLTMGGGTDPDSFVISFTNFTINDFTFSSGTVTVSPAGEDRLQVDMDVTTSEGPFDIVVYYTDGETSLILHTETPGTMGPYQVSMNNVTIPDDWETVPASGTITFTAEGKTATLDFNGKYLPDDPPYEYSESS